jgi:hypothetical protein
VVDDTILLQKSMGSYVFTNPILLHFYQKVLKELSEATEDIRKRGDLICILPIERCLQRLTIDKYSCTFMVNEHGLHKLVMHLYINCGLAKIFV